MFLLDFDSFITSLKKHNYLNCSYWNPYNIIKIKYLHLFINGWRLLVVCHAYCWAYILWLPSTLILLFKFCFRKGKRKPMPLHTWIFSSLRVSEKLPEPLICLVIFQLFKRTLTFCLPSSFQPPIKHQTLMIF